MEEDADVKADLHYKLAYIKFSKKEYAGMKSNALKAAALRSNWGQPYLLIGKAYAAYSQKYGSTELEKQAVYWVAVDKFKKAKSVDPECAEEARSLINDYSRHFPRTEEAFFEGIKQGDTYKVGAWINESTKARLTE
ncbi:hypothetical protein L3049_19095 [Labilibaculum sp. DW002]|uniref:Outer membrane lipoprotein BamD-like domain-containing protein n=1 Tax=Paralabilibaculum antarcticum TaxID=2912572 RepID=A0ABT5VZU3_9BACT|nr:hypothetical protein [Labilibaculum sp. DW002]MDE5420103.1 hypothetical protein [Labilibaculum sp. DW002]